jgi:hypothetical protein
MAIENEAALELEDREWIRKELRARRRRASPGSSHRPWRSSPPPRTRSCSRAAFAWPSVGFGQGEDVGTSAEKSALEAVGVLRPPYRPPSCVPLRRFGTPTWRMPSRCLTESPARERRPVARLAMTEASPLLLAVLTSGSTSRLCLFKKNIR